MSGPGADSLLERPYQFVGGNGDAGGRHGFEEPAGTAYGWYNGVVGLAALPASLLAGLLMVWLPKGEVAVRD